MIHILMWSIYQTGDSEETNGTALVHWTWTGLNYRRNLGHTYHLVKMRTGHPADIQTVPGAVWSATVN